MSRSEQPDDDFVICAKSRSQALLASASSIPTGFGGMGTATRVNR